MTDSAPTTTQFAPTIVGETCIPLGQQIQGFADSQPHKTALIDDDQTLTWSQLVARANRIANQLRAQGLQPGNMVAGLSENNADYVAIFLGTLIAGGCMVPLSGMASAVTLAVMINDCDARFLFVSARNNSMFHDFHQQLTSVPEDHCIGIDFVLGKHELCLERWLADSPDTFEQTAVTLDSPFNLIYSSGTTGIPKGILHDYRFRSRQFGRIGAYGMDQNVINLVSTPLYSNTTLVSILPTLFIGGTTVLMAKFDALGFLKLAEQYRVTHAMLVPVQYQRILAVPDFDDFDLSSFQLKMSASAPLHSDVIREALARWPGNIREIYGLTEGGISTSLDCAAFPDKWDSVGKPSDGADLRIIDDNGDELPIGEIGEIVGRSGIMMRGYYRRDDLTREMLWTSPEGQVLFRSGDMGRLDTDGFLFLLDRRKDMIISGGFNVYAADLEKVLLDHPAVNDAAVIAIPSAQWGETPLALITLQAGDKSSATDILNWANERLGKAQRLSAVEVRTELPRSAIGKILKKELRAPYWR